MGERADRPAPRAGGGAARGARGARAAGRLRWASWTGSSAAAATTTRRCAREPTSRASSAGGIPLAAEQRIRELAGGGTAFTSGLSISDFALTHRDGVRPICQVMGSSVYKVGWQNYPWGSGWGSAGSLTELRQLTDAWNHARALALGRLEEEAQLAGCHAVVDVTFERQPPRRSSTTRSRSSSTAPPCTCPSAADRRAGADRPLDARLRRCCGAAATGRWASSPARRSSTSCPGDRRAGRRRAGSAASPTRSSPTSPRASTRRARWRSAGPARRPSGSARAG